MFNGHQQHVNVVIDDLDLIMVPDLASQDANYFTLGSCTRGGDFTPKIMISEHYWSYMSDGEREMLIDHELGHCVLNREHDATWIEVNGDLVPKSLMYPYAFNESIFFNHYQYYMLELFH